MINKAKQKKLNITNYWMNKEFKNKYNSKN